jgi:orotidine-5'-phosphate decarboxylase
LKYIQKLKNVIGKNGSHLIIGLDTDPEKIPFVFSSCANPVAEFNKTVIKCTKDIVAGYKLNMAFYEALAEKGVHAVRQTLLNTPAELITICDAKRGDIDNTSELYAKAYLDKYGFDAITISPYMGKDTVEPFLKRKNKFVYLLALTSNRSYKDFQKLKCGNSFLYETVIRKSKRWSKEKNLGYVFGANHLTEIKKFTERNKDIPLLIPGIGAQKNDLKKLLRSIKNDMYVINSSRGIIYSANRNCNKNEFKKIVRSKAEEINSMIKSVSQD